MWTKYFPTQMESLTLVNFKDLEGERDRDKLLAWIENIYRYR